MVTRKDSSRRRTTCLPIVSPSVATRCQHQLGVHQMNKFEQFSSLGHQMSAQLNKFEQVSRLGYQMSLSGVWQGAYRVRSHVQTGRGGLRTSLHSEVSCFGEGLGYGACMIRSNALWVMVTCIAPRDSLSIRNFQVHKMC